MATQRVIYFSGQIELSPYVQPMKNAEFASKFPEIKGRRYDSFSMMTSTALTRKELLPVTRMIFYKKNPSLHKCDARCQHAKGGNCECSCGGKNHGIAA